MDIWEFMKTESAREDVDLFSFVGKKRLVQRKEAKEREMVSWGQFLKESARNPDIEEANQFGECSTTVHAVVHHLEETVDETAEVEEAEVQGGASQTKLPDIANQYQENGQEEEVVFKHSLISNFCRPVRKKLEKRQRKCHWTVIKGTGVNPLYHARRLLFLLTLVLLKSQRSVLNIYREMTFFQLAITGNETKEMKDNELPKEQDAPTVTDKPTEHD